MSPKAAFFPVWLAVSLLILLLAISSARSSAAETPKWLTGERLRNQLDQKVSVTWSGVPLRRALKSLSDSQHVAIMLDRRVDPEQKIELTLDDVTLDAALKSIALKMKIGVGQVGSVFYFGPEATASAFARWRRCGATKSCDCRLLSARSFSRCIPGIGTTALPRLTCWPAWPRSAKRQLAARNRFPPTCGPPPTCRR